MNSFKYPIESEDLPRVVRAHNRATDLGQYGKSGHMAIAFDVWRDGEHLWRSYSLDDSEPIDAWCKRNYPNVRAPAYNLVKMGVAYGVPGLDRYPVPTQDALFVRLTYPQIVQVLRAALATAQYPAKPEGLDLVPVANTLRQRMHQANGSWINLRVIDVENHITIRAIMGQVDEMRSTAQQARYEVSIIPREGSGLSHPLDATTATFPAPMCDLADSESRRIVIKLAKQELGVTGLHAVARKASEDAATLALTAHPNNLTINRIQVYPKPESETPKGLDLD